MPGGGRRPWPTARWQRYLLLTTLLVLLCCTGIGLGALASFNAATERIEELSARATGTVTATGLDGGATVRVSWPADGGRQAALVPLEGTAPAAGTRTEIAYDPRDPARAVIPGAAVLRSVDRAATGMGFAAVFWLGVAGFTGWLLLSRGMVFGGDSRPVRVRRIRVQRGLLTRSWLELEHPPRWVPVHFEPVLVTLPTPGELRVHRDPATARWIGFETEDGTRLVPSGPARSSEPPGRRTDNPSRTDEAGFRRAAAANRLRSQFIVNSPRLAVAPLVGALWAILDGSGLVGWLAATLLVATLGLWLAAVRGADPS